MPTPELIRLGASEWARELSGLTGEQVKHGLDEWNENWPPSCAEFKKICTNKNDTLHRTGAYKNFVALPKPPRDKKKALGFLSDMKKALI